MPDLSCSAAIRPGAASNSCTLNFVVTDGVDLYVGAAGHCAHVGKRLRVAGVPGEVGTFVLARSNYATVGDWAFARIDAEDRAWVDPEMCRFAGPHAGPTGATARTPLPGEVVLHYGHGASSGSREETRARAGPVVVDVFSASTFTFVSNVDVGDSGSPVRAATGEAAGIAIGTLAPGQVPNLVVASQFTLAMDDLAAHLGRPVQLVEGASPLVAPLVVA